MPYKELKPCPFCGGKAGMSHGITELSFERYCFVSCEKCHSKSANYFIRRHGEKYECKATEAWNRRAKNG